MFVQRACRHLLYLLFSLGLAYTSLIAQPQAELLDRALFFSNPAYTQATLSPDGAYIAFLKPHDDVLNLFTVGRDASIETARPVTREERPILHYAWSRDGTHLLFIQDQEGNENYHLYAVDINALWRDSLSAPLNLTPYDGARALLYARPQNDAGAVIVGMNDRDPIHNDLYRVSIESGERALLFENTAGYNDFVIDNDGTLRLGLRQEADGQTVLYDLTGTSPRAVLSCSYTETCRPLRFHSDGHQLYIASNTGDHDLIGLRLLNVETGEMTHLESDPQGEVDFGEAWFDEASGELLATYYVGNRQKVYPKSKAVKRDYRILDYHLVFGQQKITSSSTDMRYHLAEMIRDKDPGTYYLYDRKEGSVKQLFRSRPALTYDKLASMLVLEYEARDGTPLGGFLTLPKGSNNGDFPLVVLPHGGPWSRDYWGYDGFVQFLANRGYAIFQPNFRGSAGFGKKFLNAGNKQWGTGVMQHDITDGVQYLITDGLVDPERIAIFGGSYGGYAALAGVTFTPDLYAAAIPFAAPSNLITLIESFPAYWKSYLEGTWYRRVGNPALDADREDLKARSPLFFSDQIKTPLMIVHGANDPRVKQAEADQLVVALRDRGVEVEYLLALDEGYGFRRPKNRMALAAALEHFLAKHLGGRKQEEIDPSTKTTLEALRMDIRSINSTTSDG